MKSLTTSCQYEDFATFRFGSTEPMSKAVEIENCYLLHIPGIYVRGTRTQAHLR